MRFHYSIESTDAVMTFLFLKNATLSFNESVPGYVAVRVRWMENDLEHTVMIPLSKKMKSYELFMYQLARELEKYGGVKVR